MATKYLLVPANQMDARDRKSANESYSHLRNLDNRLRAVLDDSSLSEHQKYAQYQRIMQMQANMDRRDPDMQRVTRKPPPPPADNYDYLEGVTALFDEQYKQPFARAYPQKRQRTPELDGTPTKQLRFDDSVQADDTQDMSSSRFDVLWSDSDIERLKERVVPGGEALVDALSKHFGDAIDYNDVRKKQGLRIGNKRFGNAKLENAINNLADVHAYATTAGRQLAQILTAHNDGDLIRNDMLRKEYVDRPNWSKRKGSRHLSSAAAGSSHSRSSLFGTPKARSTPMRGHGLLKRWQNIYK